MSILRQTAVATAAAGLVLVAGGGAVSHPLTSAPLVKHPFALKSAATLPVQPAGAR